MMRKLDALIMPHDPVMLEAIDVMKRYHDAQQAGKPDAEIERLRQATQRLFQAISDYQLAALGHQPLVRH